METKIKSPLKKGSIIGKTLRLLGMNGSFEKPSSSLQEKSQRCSINVRAYLSADRRVQEIYAEKAMLIWESRHDKWKAGGPV
jgi:hypothetical protein